MTSKRSRKHTLVQALAGLGVAIFVFSLGVAVGQGKVGFGSDALFRKSDTNKNLPANLDYRSVEEVYDALKSDYDGKLDAGKLLDGLKGGMATATGDPYTEYFNARDAKSFEDDLNGTFTGIGAELSKDQDAIIIVSPITGFPAEKAGLKPKDIILEINGKNTQGITISQAVSNIRGPKDSHVKLTVLRGSQQLKFDIIRDNITIPTVNSKILDGNIGYIQITTFGNDTSDLAKKAADNFKSKGVKGIVLDVRSDPGGLLDAAVNVASLWLPSDKTVLQEKRDNVVTHTYKSNGSAQLEGIPTVVLINEGSASASEIVAGALHDNHAATLYGVKSFGKGSVQQVHELSNGGALKVTIARWYTPDGQNIDKHGIDPQLTVKDRSDEDIKAGRDPQLDAATAFLKK